MNHLKNYNNNSIFKLLSLKMYGSNFQKYNKASFYNLRNNCWSNALSVQLITIIIVYNTLVKLYS